MRARSLRYCRGTQLHKNLLNIALVALQDLTFFKAIFPQEDLEYLPDEWACVRDAY